MAKYPFNTIVVGTEPDQLHPDIIVREKNRLLNWYLPRLNKDPKNGGTSWKLRTKEDVETSINANVEKAIQGYKRAPRAEDAERTFIKRLSIFTKYHLEDSLWTTEEKERLFTTAATKRTKSTKEALNNFIANANVPSRAIESDSTDKDGLPDFSTSMVYGALTNPVEQAQYIARRMHYEDEFEFNKSSDTVLLEAVLADEILLLRITHQRMAGRAVADDLVDDINKRLRENLKLLGVSRNQRIADDSSNKGSVAELSVNVEEKLGHINQLRDEELRTKLIDKIMAQYADVSSKDLLHLAEELEMLRQRAMRPEMQRTSPISTINDIPDYADIDKILSGAESLDG